MGWWWSLLYRKQMRVGQWLGPVVWYLEGMASFQSEDKKWFDHHMLNSNISTDGSFRTKITKHTPLKISERQSFHDSGGHPSIVGLAFSTARSLSLEGFQDNRTLAAHKRLRNPTNRNLWAKNLCPVLLRMSRY
ncbi:hypothetical protein CEXT_22621 [Caerostris extrusa]|uniref:Uncharacterized protein n=1 Tax=Caerostris extrusa TaxID=172846 RepID=A0AAV4MGR1_CAEEX|nr:hypothetical protein CEXT_22621 [Caerostris extrusa]